MDKELPLSFDTLAFPDDISKNVFKEWLNMMDTITPEFVNREEFNSKHWNFLLPTWKKTKGREQYTLQLPTDIKIRELPAIMRRAQIITFWKNTPEYIW
jgi:hypothetical protein